MPRTIKIDTANMQGHGRDLLFLLLGMSDEELTRLQVKATLTVGTSVHCEDGALLDDYAHQGGLYLGSGPYGLEMQIIDSKCSDTTVAEAYGRMLLDKENAA